VTNRRASVRFSRTPAPYAVIVLETDTGAARPPSNPGPAGPSTPPAAKRTVTAAFDSSFKLAMVVVPMTWISLTEQGKPNRPEISWHGREVVRTR
jgi:hypothetical protein